ncbi:hypothetical protein P9A47_gp30 [Xanthomonas phage Elanor]|uniref:Uncharacterized protein n=1 Tax=Xanthomonas phage Elanor TaxID=2939127 RepID=A0A9E7E1H7_9CAUD|nr:hypothetical protein P9A47_gp30 [Xanthomonas phage Elanor]URA06998.1 hypothetical protein Elanor_BL40030 [Xanthomonas phage Elanor]
MALYFLAIPKQSGAQTIQNGRRAVIVKIADGLATQAALDAARAAAAAGDTGNEKMWSRATGGYMSEDSVTIAGNLVWLDQTAETPEVLTGAAGPGGGASIANGATVSVRNSAGADAHSGTAVVAGSTLTGINMAATVALVDTADTIPLQNSAGASKGNATVTVAAGAPTNVRAPATSAIVANGEALTVPITGTGTATATVTVANGVVTGIALS